MTTGVDRPTRLSRRRVLASVGVLCVVAAFVVGGFVLSNGDSWDPVAGFAQSEDTIDQTRQTTGPESIATAVPDTVACDVSTLAQRLATDAPATDYQPSGSPSQLAEGTIILRGQIASLFAHPEGAVVWVKVRDVAGAESDDFASGVQLVIPGAEAPAMGPGIAPPASLNGDVVAFVSTDSIPAVPMRVLPEGLWVGCGDGGPAEPLAGRPVAPGWNDVLGDGISLGELWQAAVFGSTIDGRTSALPPPLIAGDGTAVFDVRLVSGERFRLSLPESMAALDLLTEPGNAEPIVLSGVAGRVSIAFDFCQDEDGMAVNRQGSAVRVGASRVRLCRADELLSTTVDIASDLDGVSDIIDTFDVRPISSGALYGPAVTGLWPQLADCSGCVPWGPMVFPSAGVSVNRTGSTQITAVSLDDLREVWTVNTGGAAAYLHGGPDGGVYVEVTGGNFQRLDPATGDVVWTVEQDEAERNAGFTGHDQDSFLLRSSFQVAGDHRPPLLRSVDVTTGDVLWTATGRGGTAWQASRPVRIDGVIVLMDVATTSVLAIDTPDLDIGGGTLRAYDAMTGLLAWTTDLESPTEAYETNLITTAEFETGRGLLVHTIDGDLIRVDPVTGEVLWRTAVGRARMDGTDFATNGELAISLTIQGTQFLLDPDTGESP